MHYGDVPLRGSDVITRFLLTGAVTFTLALLVACSPSPVTLGSMSYPASPLLHSHPPVATVPSGACPGSLRTARSGPDVYGAWWEVRDDSSSILMVGRSTDSGKTWNVAQPADTVDRSRRGCTRPAPAIAADSATNYVDIAYFMEPPEGPGVFFTHSMDARTLGVGDGIFHAPVAVMYGDQPSSVSVAADGDKLVVAYEEPNGERSMVGLALSRSMGHIFEDRLIVSQQDLPARDPFVALRGDSVVVQWSERPDSIKVGGRIAVRSAMW
ncbi:MAG: hypothetical protein ABI229_09755 [Gemmatimonadaceae bacterium]